MHSYEIAITNMTDDAQMYTIQEALTTASIGDASEYDVDCGAYLVYGKPRSIFVSPSDVVKTVRVLNALGFETDEDELPARDSLDVLIDEVSASVSWWVE